MIIEKKKNKSPRICVPICLHIFSNTLCLEFVLCVDFFPFIGSSLSRITCSANILFDPHEIPKMFIISIPNKIIYYVSTRLYSSKGVVATV